MAAPVLRAIARGFPATQVLDHIRRTYPHYANLINAAHSVGYTSDIILKHITNKEGENPDEADEYLTEHERTQKRDAKQKKRAALGLVGSLGISGALAAGTYAYATRNQAIRPNAILPPLKQVQKPRGLTTQGPQLQLPYTPNSTGPTPTPTTPTQSPSYPIQHTIRPTQGPQLQLPYTPNSTMQRSPQQSEARNVTLLKNVREDTRVQTILKNGYDLDVTASILRQLIPKPKLELLEKAEGGLEQVVNDYAQYLQVAPQEQNLPNAQDLQQQQQVIQRVPEEIEQKPFIEAAETSGERTDLVEKKESLNQEIRTEILQKATTKGKGEIIMNMPYKELNVRMKDLKIAEENLIKGNISRNPDEPVEVSFNIDTGEKTLEDGYHRYLLKRGGTIENALEKGPEGNIRAKIKFVKNEHRKGSGIEQIEAEPEDIKRFVLKNEIKIGTEKETRPIVEPETQGNLAILPKGQIGEIEEIKHGVAKLNVDGKILQEKLGDIKQEPKGVEEAVRYVLNSIPEKSKSTSLESTIFLSLPEVNIMLTKFWDGKWAWYKDITEEIYRDISIGLYEPKGEAKTGIAEYKPGVIDSRGAGFYKDVKSNPKYSSENKGITWGYALNEYDAFHQIQNIKHKISKERYDKEGKLIVPKKTKKSSTD